MSLFAFVNDDSLIKKQELSSAILPTVRKSQLRDLFDQIKKQFDDEDKARKAREGKEAVESVKKYFEENPDSKYFVAVINRSGNTKALGQAINQARGSDKATMLFSVDESSGKVAHQCIIPKVRTVLESIYLTAHVFYLLGSCLQGLQSYRMGPDCL